MRQGVSRRDPAKGTFWRERIAEHIASGLSVREFCRRHDLKEVAFYWWRRELARRDAEQTPSVHRDAEEACVMPVKASHHASSTGVTFMPVHVTDDPAPEGGGQIEIELTDGRRVRITGTVNREMLTEVLAVLTSTSPVESGRRTC